MEPAIAAWPGKLLRLRLPAAAVAVGVIAAIVLARTIFQTEVQVPASPVPIRPESNGQIAYLSGPGAGTIFGLSRVVVANHDGSAGGPVSAEGNLTDVAWSPDGDRIAYVNSAGEGGGGAIYVMDADGSDRRVVVQADFDQYLTKVSWSPTGDWLAYDSSVGSGPDFQYRIMAVASGGGSSVELSSGEGDDLAPAWSPDGTRIAFIRWLGVTEGPLGAHLEVMGADGSRLRTIADLHHVASPQPAWSPDGRTIAYLDGARLMLIGADGADPHEIYRCTPGCPVGGVSWSPDGSMLAVTRGDGRNGDVVVLAADGSEARMEVPYACCLTWQPVLAKRGSRET